MYDSVYQRNAMYSSTTNMMQRVELRITKAEMKIMIIIAKNTIVATMRTGLNISFVCVENPIKKPVPMRETTVPRA